MTETNRIVSNTLATYGRSLFALVLGLFSARWVLCALGKEDYGLFGVVGSIIVFVGLLNGIMSSAVARYYAYAIGEARLCSEEDGREIIVKWFNSAVFIHTVLPFLLVLVGCPIGMYAIKHWLIIPVPRIDSCQIVFMLALFSAFVNMVSVPYIAMYRAKQLIAELSFWGVLTTSISFICAYWLRYWDGDALVAYAVYMTLVPAVITSIQVVRARRQFDVCKINVKYLADCRRLRQLFKFAFGEFFGWFGSSIRDNGVPILINVNFGSAMNAAYSIANQVSAQTVSLSSAMIGAIMPAVTTAEGAGGHDRAIRLSFRSIKFGVLLILVFCVPLVLEIDEVLKLWLVNPPEETAVFCRCVLIALIVHKLGWGHHLAMLAKGRIVAYQIIVGVVGATGLLWAWIAIRLGYGALGIGVSFVIAYALMTVIRALFAKKLCQMPIDFWLRSVVLPIIITMFASFIVGSAVVCVLEPSFLRIVVTTLVVNLALAAMGWILVLDCEERSYIVQGLKQMSNRWFNII